MGKVTCTSCGGSKKVTRQRADGNGTIEDECRACSGTGEVSTGGDEGWS